jgi:hypothetical protein
MATDYSIPRLCPRCRTPQIWNGRKQGCCKTCEATRWKSRYAALSHEQRAAFNRRPQTVARKASDRKVADAYAHKFPIKVKAHKAVMGAIRAGSISRQPCEKCGARAQAHHDDYAQPLVVRWLCPLHHKEHHLVHGPGLNGEVGR